MTPNQKYFWGTSDCACLTTSPFKLRSRRTCSVPTHDYNSAKHFPPLAKTREKTAAKILAPHLTLSQLMHLIHYFTFTSLRLYPGKKRSSTVIYTTAKRIWQYLKRVCFSHIEYNKLLKTWWLVGGLKSLAVKASASRLKRFYGRFWKSCSQEIMDTLFRESEDEEKLRSEDEVTMVFCCWNGKKLNMF